MRPRALRLAGESQSFEAYSSRHAACKRAPEAMRRPFVSNQLRLKVNEVRRRVSMFRLSIVKMQPEAMAGR
jgi:hypothetical protein